MEVPRILLIFLYLTTMGGGFSLETSSQPPRMFLFRPSPRLEMDLRLTTQENGREASQRTLKLAYDQTSGGTRLLVGVVHPTALRNLKFLRYQDLDNIQLWVKTSRGVRRLSVGSRPEALFNSTFTTADFDLESGKWIFLEELSEGRRLYSKIIQGDSFGFSRQEVILRTIDGLVLESRYYNKTGVLTREYKVKSWDPEGPDQGFPHSIEVVSLLDNRSSLLEILSMTAPETWPANTFSPGTL